MILNIYFFETFMYKTSVRSKALVLERLFMTFKSNSSKIDNPGFELVY